MLRWETGQPPLLCSLGSSSRRRSSLLKRASTPKSSSARTATPVKRAINKLGELAVPLGEGQDERAILEKCAQTALNSKLINHEKGFFAKMAVEAVMSLEEGMDLDLIRDQEGAGWCDD
eukprot:Sspe_Gene.52207::Locus_28928_Transcript_1_1_Confidence_1.000_Length_1808::g.52207::m.52207